MVRKCLDKASEKKNSSIAFPAIGTGNLGLQRDEVAQTMINAAVEFGRSSKARKMIIYFVIFPKDTETLMVRQFYKKMTNVSH